MASNLYSIGLSGLQSSTARIATTGQNTSNVDTEGYSRQTTSTVSVAGGGVRIQDTSRVVNQYVNQQVWTDTSSYSYYQSYQLMMSNVDSMVGEDSVAISTYLDTAFSALQTANSDPADESFRSSVLTSLDTLANQFNELSTFIRDQKQLANEEINDRIAVINNYTEQVASLNSKIQAQEALTSTSANELRDQQEQIVKELSTYLDIKVAYDDNNLMTLKLAAGQPLVLQDKANSLELVNGGSDPQSLSLQLNFGKYSVGVSSEDIGGAVGGLMSYRDEFATSAQRMLGQQAWALADSMNEQNRLGLDLDGNYGATLFSVGDISVAAADRNSDPNTTIDVRLTDGGSSDITTYDYEVVMSSPTAFTVRTLDENGKIVSESDLIDTTTATANSNGYFEVEGFGIEVQLSGTGSYQTGDTYEFAPTQDIARQIELTATSGSALALASPITVSSADTNLSDAKISISSITDTDAATSEFAGTPGLSTSAPQTIEFTATDTFNVLDGSGNVLATQTVTDYENLLAAAGITGAGYDVSLGSVPRAGDSFSIAFNTSGDADNYNGLLLAGIQNQTVVEGKSTLSNAYTSLVTEVGSLTSTLKTNMEASEVVMNQSQSTRDQISAVSLDEEAVNLLRYQQSYSAAAQVISAARETFSTLLSVVG